MMCPDPTGADPPDVLTEAVTRVASVTNDPLRHSGQLLEQGNGVREFVRLTRRDPERDGVPSRVGDHASLGAIAATRAAKCLTMVSLSLRSPFRAAPAAFWCARTFVPSRNTIPS
jgi:hypothetical protein